MYDQRSTKHVPPINPLKYGVSFSVKQCRNFKADPEKVLSWLINEMGFRRFRLMSYWNEIEKTPGSYDFSQLDQQIDMIASVQGVMTLCLGARQPRWPENHWPDWAWDADEASRSAALLNFISKVVARYKNIPSIVSWQLENEALLENFGERSEINRARLRHEYDLVKAVDATRPILMSTSTSWGIPLRKPVPDAVGFSLYNIVFDKGRYRQSLYQPFIFRLRARLIRLIHRRPSFIHELQAEPWGPKAIWEMSSRQQAKSMNPQQIQQNIHYAKQTGLYPIDLWGGEWWYVCTKTGNKKVPAAVLKELT